jgi:hypothetical protein
MATARDRLLPASGYDEDFYSWALAQAALLRARRFDELDLSKLAEQVEDLARREAKELRSRYAVLLQHLLKWQIQPEHRSWSWAGSIARERGEIDDHLADNPGLKSQRQPLFERAYRLGVRGAVADTNLPIQRFPSTCPFTLDQATDESFWPGEPWPGFADT